MSALDACITNLKSFSKKEIGKCYTAIQAEAKDAPGNVRIIEQRELSSYYHAVYKRALSDITEAFRQEGVKMPSTVWMETVTPKLKQPKFSYIQVVNTEALGDLVNPSRKVIMDSVNEQKFSPMLAGASGVAVLAGLGAKIAASHVESVGLSVALSTSGIVLMIIGGAGILYCGYTIYSDGRKSNPRRYDVPDDDQATQVDLNTLLAQQQTINQKNMEKWIDYLAALAKAGAAGAEKEEAQEV